MGLGDTNTYKNYIYIKTYAIYNRQFEWIYPIGIEQGNYIALAIDPTLGWIAIDPFMSRALPRPMCGGRGAVSRGAGGVVHRGARGASKGPAHGAGPGPGPAHEGITSYSAQEGINSKGNIIAT